jgi:hypothetical protein
MSTRPAKSAADAAGAVTNATVAPTATARTMFTQATIRPLDKGW